MFHSLQIACDYRSRHFDPPARWADLCPHRAEAKVIFVAYLFTFRGAIHSQPGLLSLCGVCLSSKPTCRCLNGCITESSLRQVRTGFASSQGQLLQMIEFSQDKAPSYQPQAAHCHIRFRICAKTLGLWRYSRGAVNNCSLCQSLASLLYYVYSVYI